MTSLIIMFSLMLIPLLILGLVFITKHHKINQKECLIMILGSLFILIPGSLISANPSLSDKQILSGEVTDKRKVKVSCSHSYSCNCRQECSGTGNNRSCSQVCDTCYEHSYDFSWYVFTNLGQDFTIDRVNSQGTIMPPRWQAIYIGEPVSLPGSFENLIKYSQNSIWRMNQHLVEKYPKSLPEYPEIFDYYHVNRIMSIPQGLISPDEINLANRKLEHIQKTLGPVKHANVNVIFTDLPDEYSDAVWASWEGGKENDILVVIGVTKINNTPTFSWVKVHSWSKFEIFNITLRDKITDLKTLNINDILEATRQVTMEHFTRMDMEEYEYLRDGIGPSTTSIIVTAILLLIFSIGTSWYSVKYD